MGGVGLLYSVDKGMYVCESNLDSGDKDRTGNAIIK